MGSLKGNVDAITAMPWHVMVMSGIDGSVGGD
jgi:hypothetical protein